MQTVTVGTKYQIVIPKEVREQLTGLRPGSKVAIGQVDKNTATLKTNPNDWVKRTRGMMTEAWKNIDPIAELEKMRDEWDERPRKIEKNRK